MLIKFVLATQYKAINVVFVVMRLAAVSGYYMYAWILIYWIVWIFAFTMAIGVLCQKTKDAVSASDSLTTHGAIEMCFD